MVGVSSSGMNVGHANHRFHYSVRCPHIVNNYWAGSKAGLDCVKLSSFCHCIRERFVNFPADLFANLFLRKNSYCGVFYISSIWMCKPGPVVCKSHQTQISWRIFFQSTAEVWPIDNTSEQNLVVSRFLVHQKMDLITILSSNLAHSNQAHFRRVLKTQEPSSAPGFRVIIY